MSKTLDPKSSAYTNFATLAKLLLNFKMVSHTGIEPVTPWLKVKCSTDWANGSQLWGDRRDLNPRQPVPQTGALPTELRSPYIYNQIVLINKMERETRVELATFSLEGWRSTNWATPAKSIMVGVVGFEPTTPCSQGRCATELRYTPF